MYQQPTRILDLHTHLFNVRYIPIASIIAHAMNKDESKLAKIVARFLVKIAGSSYEPSEDNKEFNLHHQDHDDMAILNSIWSITEHELTATARSLDVVRFGVDNILDVQTDLPEMRGLMDSELLEIIQEMDAFNYAEEGWSGELPTQLQAEEIFDELKAFTFGGVLRKARWVVKKALYIVSRLMDPNFWGKAMNYLEFFFTMLHSEEKMVKKLFRIYGNTVPPLQVVHFMMDMQMAYNDGAEKPYYAFNPEQLDKMERLQRNYPARVIGFAAFDPRRDDWMDVVTSATIKGFIGFKFYPAMGYKPSGNEGVIQYRVDAFFDHCVAHDIPIFVHCTPEGFQTKEKLGTYADPKYWKPVFENARWSTLRLCFGHAGGGIASNELPGGEGVIHSKGWMAEEQAQWDDADNYARKVAELCVTYPNVYCEMGYILEVLDEPWGASRLESNIERARLIQGSHDFMSKLCYGTDWHMPHMVDNTDAYYHHFLSLFNKNHYLPYLDKFFWRNGYNFLQVPL